MKLTIDSLQKAGAFVGAPVKKDIKWTQGDEEMTATVYVRNRSYTSVIAESISVAKKQDQVAAKIAACICDEDGNSIFTVDEITGKADPERGELNGSLAAALFMAICEVEGTVGKPKASAKLRKSGTS